MSLMKTQKAVPIVLRESVEGVQILVFTHPVAGVQLVKGSVEPGESASEAALRELEEESGITEAVAVQSLGSWESGYQEQTWHLQEVRPSSPLPSQWEHFTQDGGGHLFAFHWHALAAEPSQEWHPVYRAVLREVTSRLYAIRREPHPPVPRGAA